ncbi:MAG: hypothetical protein KBD62_32245 [Kofleriaceae bacterium]|nr:hypothetical protein [Kofleriaceae bacterium]
MADMEFVAIETSMEHGATSVQEQGGGRPEVAEVAEARRTGRITPMGGPAVEYLEVGPRQLSEAARERVKAIRDRLAAPEKPAAEAPPVEAPAAATATPTTVTADDDAGDEGDDDPDAPPVAGTGAEPVKAPPAAPAPDVELKSTIERQAALIEKHRAEAEAARKAADEATRAREQAATADEDAYLADPSAAVRSWLARSLGVKDAKDPVVEKELDDLIVDLIAARNGVSLDPAHTADRRSVLTQRSWEAEKRRRAGQDRDASNSPRDGAPAVQAARAEIARRLGTAKDATPHLLALSMTIDGREPEAVVWEALQKGVANGTIDPNASDDHMFEQARSAAEKFYAARAEAFRASLKLGTAASSTPPDPQASVAAALVKDDRARQGHGPRTITNAAASVAPATSTQKPAEVPPLRHETDQERRARVLKKHLGNLPK